MADVCLLLEGTYPYVTGGVSSWVHDLIISLDGITFDIVAILPSKNYVRKYKYKIPPNVNSISNLYLNEIEDGASSKLGYFQIKKFFRELTEAVFELKKGRFDKIKEIADIFEKYRPAMGDFINSKESWNFFLKLSDCVKLNSNFTFTVVDV